MVTTIVNNLRAWLRFGNTLWMRHASDLLPTAGLVALGCGLYQLSPAWCLVIMGGIVFVLGALWARAR